MFFTLRKVSLGLALACALTMSAHALTVVDSKIITTAKEYVSVTFVGSHAGYLDLVNEHSPNEQFIFANHGTPIGTTVDLGLFNAGEEIVLRLDVESGNKWYTGPGSRNADGQVHITFTDLGGGVWQGSWEDLYSNGDHDYNDLEFTIQSKPFDTVVPEPATLALTGLGLVSLTGLVRRRRHQA